MDRVRGSVLGLDGVPVVGRRGHNLIRGSGWDPSRLLTVEFEPLSPDFDVWVDDLRFYSCPNASCLPTCTREAPVACAASGGEPAGCWPAGTSCADMPKAVGLVSIWGSGPTDAWAVGVSATLAGAVFHWDGTRWAPSDAGVKPPLWDVGGNGAADVWAIGDRGTVLRWNGSAWSASTPGATTSLNAVWASTPGDAWAVRSRADILHWTGGPGWAATPGVTTWLANLWGSSATNIWAVGGGGAVVHFRWVRVDPCQQPHRRVSLRRLGHRAGGRRGGRRRNDRSLRRARLDRQSRDHRSVS